MAALLDSGKLLTLRPTSAQSYCPTSGSSNDRVLVVPLHVRRPITFAEAKETRPKQRESGERPYCVARVCWSQLPVFLYLFAASLSGLRNLRKLILQFRQLGAAKLIHFVNMGNVTGYHATISTASGISVQGRCVSKALWRTSIACAAAFLR